MRFVVRYTYWIVSFLLCFSWQSANANDLQESKSGVWSFGLAASQVNLKSGEGEELTGFRSTSQLGWGHLGETWYGFVSLDILAGPYETAQQSKLLVDYAGTGVSAGIALSADNQSLRTKEGNYGFLLSLHYADITGRSIKTAAGSASSVGEISNLQARVQNFSILPAIFFCWLQPARPRGNTPELLMTRIEGYFLSIGLSTPFQANYAVSYQKDNEIISNKVTLRGYSAIISLTALIGS